jgi:hypothetical protein
MPDWAPLEEYLKPLGVGSPTARPQHSRRSNVPWTTTTGSSVRSRPLAQVETGQTLTHDAVGTRLAKKLAEHDASR